MRLQDSPSPLPLDSAAHDEAAAPAAASPLHAKAAKAAEKFESFFIGEMFRQMRKSAREFGDRDGERSNDDMLDLAHSMVADVLAGQHAFGVADLILRQVLPSLPAGPAETPGFKSSDMPVALNK
ncbi:MAG: flagellar biosynthesis protein FlgJ [Actinomycetota bacterium]